MVRISGADDYKLEISTEKQPEMIYHIASKKRLDVLVFELVFAHRGNVVFVVREVSVSC